MPDAPPRPALAPVLEALTRIAARLALIGGSLASGRLFWVRAALGENQLRMHDCTADGSISIGGVPEQLYGEGFIAAWHEVLERELGGPRAAAALYEAGRQGGRWEALHAVEKGIWVPPFLRPFIGRKVILERMRASPVFHALVKETMRIFLRMIVTEGGWGVIEDLDLRRSPARLVVTNAPEPRRLGRTGRCSCDLMAGITAGYFEALLGAPCVVRETSCASNDARACTFEITIDAAPAREADRRESGGASASEEARAESMAGSAGR